MAKIKYEDKNFRADTLDLIETANIIIREYAAQGFDLTVRQLHYQLVSRDVYDNTQKNYNRLGRILSDARMAGLVDWEAIVDRTRNVEIRNHWDQPQDILKGSAQQYYMNHWEYQENYVEVWIEKDALVGVIKGVCRELDVPYFSCRGYSSQSEMWRAAQRIHEAEDEGKDCHIIHLSDHDPSGIDMSRDIQDRLDTFECFAEVHRLALTSAQVSEHNPPPNFAKRKDPRFKDYYKIHGKDSWELDALNPATIATLIRGAVQPFIDQAGWDDVDDQIQDARKVLTGFASNYTTLKKHLGL